MTQKFLAKINLGVATAFASILSIALIVIVNGTSCAAVHEPKQPKSIDKFKFVK